VTVVWFLPSNYTPQICTIEENQESDLLNILALLSRRLTSEEKEPPYSEFQLVKQREEVK
jgi:hypothetical protein